MQLTNCPPTDRQRDDYDLGVSIEIGHGIPDTGPRVEHRENSLSTSLSYRIA
jgi:hypothetical protein